MGGIYGVEFTRIGYTGGTMAHPSLRRIGGNVLMFAFNKIILKW